MVRRSGALLGVLAILATLLAACGGSGTASLVPSSNTVAVSAASASAAGPAPASAAVASGAAAPRAAGSGGATPSSTARVGTPAAPAAAVATPAAAGEKYTLVPDKSTASYKVAENFINQGNQFHLAEGKTGEVHGEIAIDRNDPSKSTIGEIRVDISTLQSDSGQRDDMIRGNWLESSKYPVATFKTKRLAGMSTAPYVDGTQLTFTIVGDLTIRNTTKEVTFDATATIVGGVLTGTAVAKFNMTDFGFDPPSILGILKAENAVELAMTIEANRQP